MNINLRRAAGVYSILFCYISEEILERHLISQEQAFATYSAIEKALRAASKVLMGRMRPAGHMLCRPALNAHKSKLGKT